jgi:hypothetical protein
LAQYILENKRNVIRDSPVSIVDNIPGEFVPMGSGVLIRLDTLIYKQDVNYEMRE